MPLNYEILKSVGTTDERLRELFTADSSMIKEGISDDARKRIEADIKKRAEIEDMIYTRVQEATLQTLKTSHFFSAVDLAWDSSTITQRTIPLVLYAQRRIDMQLCAKQLGDMKCADSYVKYDASHKPVGIDLPKFTEVNINILRSIISRRVAAQSARYTNLYPFFKYDCRGTSEEEKLKADLLSQRMDIMADQFGYRDLQVQWIRDMLLYPYSVVFPACRWQRDVEWYSDAEDIAAEFQASDQQVRPKARVTREGVPLTSPHPSRVFYDLAHPIQSINSDSGCEWFGFWDIARFSTVFDNPEFFNRNNITYSPDVVQWFGNYSSYFSQYYTTVTPPPMSEDMAMANDRLAQIGKYTMTLKDTSVFMAHLYLKISPAQWGIGSYPFPVWIHLVVANNKHVVAAEIMPDCPGFVFTFNTSSQRLVNMSMAHELLPFQDQLSNLYSQLLECAKRDLFGIAMINLDAFPTENPESKKALEQFRAAMKGDNFFASTTILEVSLIKFRELGIDLDKVFKIIRSEPNTELNMIINAIRQTIELSERVMALSPQEQGQQSPRETSATEVQIIAGTTENIYQFISDAIDSGRSAIKRYDYNALISCGTEEIYLPVISRYRKETAIKAGFKITSEEQIPVQGSVGNASHFAVEGTKKNLIAAYIFNSRDGAERSSNIQAAQALTQMLGILMQPAVMAMLTKDGLADIINSIIRQSGAGIDVTIEPPPGQGGTPVMDTQAAQPGPAQAQPQPQPQGGISPAVISQTLPTQ